ncbi:MAG: PilZ domain-containing protein [Sphingomonas sp.]|uniref:PilZ domain-containing protein n=1 Tax=Sphingomonas sp. TaxID=28214 RepID=UPI00122135F3|nr:PilZ domain-containing protein [Sphingomonas sp.]THD36715.1 MAG: PilZ domain-containing protein [Sphingomonas sp.]
MDQFPQDSFVPADAESAPKRKKSRDSLFLVASLTIDGRPDSTDVRVRNLSSGGLMAEYAHPVEIGTAVEVELRGVGKVAGDVAWTAAGRIGVSFGTPIDPMQARKPVSAPATAPRKDKPIKPIL